ncbi:MAG: folylpolyglutamate synthase/dihydrofolate synthase family protein [Actinomycetaceae bacterium]|nr:folylpolyglutamate synthase/dihydrofolate synthase family protein [Actinomycetaceae bacterium]
MTNPENEFDPFGLQPESLNPDDLPEQDGEATPASIVEDAMNKDVSGDLKSIMGQMNMMPDEDLEKALADDLDEAGGLDSSDDFDSDKGGFGFPPAPSEAATGARYEQIEHQILGRVPEHKVQPSLERVAMAMDLLGEPQRTYRSVHLTGTNGKTSTARMIASLLMASGRKVGRYTSPHLNTMRERISVNDAPVSEAAFVEAYEDVAPYLALVDEHSKRHDNPQMSFFEVLTVTALAAFADVPVDAAVIEVGMGGQWDATNVVDADVAVIGPIAHDHEKWLGSSLVDIAREKVGIIKPDSFVISAAQEPEVMEIIRSKADEVGAVLRVVGEDLHLLDRKLAVGGQVISVQTPAAQYNDIFLPLLGPHQADNAVLALAAMEAFNGGRSIEPAIVEEGFATATSPGRLEVVRSSPSIVIDSAHNPHGAHALATALTESFDYTNIAAVYSAMADKDVEATLSELEPVVEDIVITSMNTPRAMKVEELAEIARDVFGEDRVFVEPQLLDAIDKAVERAELGNDPAGSNGVVICGSVVLAGHARELIVRDDRK